MKIPIIDNNLCHSKGCSPTISPKLLEWFHVNSNIQYGKSLLNNKKIPLFVTDNFLIHNYVVHKKVGWLLEPKAINPNLYTDRALNFIHKHYTYVLTHEKDLVEKYNNFLFVPGCSVFAIVNETIPVKDKLVSIITSSKNQTEGHKFRIETTKKVKGYDLFGRGFKEIRFKNEALEPYMFSIAIENSISNSYFTEKVLDCFCTKTIPIYRGCDLSKWFNSDGIIYFQTHEELQDIIDNKLSKEFYESKKSAIEENYLKVTSEYLCVEDFIVKNYPFLFQ
jgi:hypothetical protein